MAPTQTEERTTDTFELEATNAMAWLLAIHAVTNKRSPMVWEDRLWLHQILVDESREQVVKKCAQIGMSTIEIFKTLHACIHRIINAIYTLPTDSDVNEFVSSKVNPIMKYNQIPTFGKDSIGEKMIGSDEEMSFLFFKGSFMERAGIMLDADYLVMDELDHCDQKTLQTYKSRIEGSDLAWLHTFSTPSAPNKRIDKQFQASDQHYWFVTCPKCGFEWYMDWPANVCRERKIFVCTKCSGEITDDARRLGRWVNKWESEGRSRGYWVSGLMKTERRTAADLLKKEAENEPWYFYNYILGKTYAGGDLTISEGMITANLSAERPAPADMCLGVDLGGHEHFYVVGNDKGIYEFGVIPYSDEDGDKGYNRIYGLMKQYDVKTCVIDGNPCTNESQEFAKSFPYKVYLSYFRPQDQAPAPFYFDDSIQDKYVVIGDRHRILSWVISEFKKGSIALFIDPQGPHWERYTSHWKALYQQTVVKPDGTEKQEWTADGDPDHFALATGYFKMAVARYKEWEPTLEASSLSEVEEITISCPKCGHKFVSGEKQTTFPCPKCGQSLSRLLFAEKEDDGYDWYYGPSEN